MTLSALSLTSFKLHSIWVLYDLFLKVYFPWFPWHGILALLLFLYPHSWYLFWIVFFSPINMCIFLLLTSLIGQSSSVVILTFLLNSFSSAGLQPILDSYFHYGTKILHSIHLFSVSVYPLMLLQWWKGFMSYLFSLI